VAVAPTIAEAAGILATAAMAVAQVEAERDDLRALVAELEARPSGVARLWADDFLGDWQRRWGVGSAPMLSRMAVQPDGSVKLACPPNTSQIMGWHAAPIPMGDHVRLAYTKTVPAGFWANPGQGGMKDPGLAGGLLRPLSSNVGSGGKRWNADVEVDAAHLEDADTFSFRVIESDSRNAHAYIYAQSPTGGASAKSYWGATIASNGKARPHDGDTRFELEVAMNTPGRPDGLASLSVDGTEVVHREDICWRSAKRPTLRVSQIFGAFMFGGGDADGPDVATWVRFSDFELEVFG
jgi:hypothetical protein